jgi:Arc/MetJ-type ribon-helix-helix transcriptional regulator
MPKRAGRPRAAVPTTKMLSLRLPIDLLEKLDSVVRKGEADTRSELIERSLRASVTRILGRAEAPPLRLLRTVKAAP